MQDTPHSILHSAKRFFSGTMVSRLSGLARDIAMAFAFGTDSALAAFLVAFRFAHLLRRLFGEGAFQTAFIPTFEELRQQSQQRAGRFFVDLYGSLTIFLVLLIAGGMVGCGLLLQGGSLSPGNAEITWLTLLMMPSLLFICLFGLNASLLQCDKHFFLPAVAPTAFNFFWIVGALSMMGMAPAQAMPWLALFVNGACCCQWFVTLPATWRIVDSFGLDSVWKGIRLYTSDIRRLAHPLLLGMIGVGAAQINNALDAIFARYASAEGPAYLWYAIRVQQLPLALIGIALSGALLPALSRAIKSGDFDKYRHLLTSTLINCLWLILPITAALFLFAEWGITLLYGRGDFGAESILQTTHCLWGYGIGLVPMALILILAPGFYALNDYRTPMCASIASMAVNIALNSWFVFGLGWGATSVAIATSLSAWLNFFWLAVALRQAKISLQTDFQN